MDHSSQQEKYLRISNFITDVVIGMSDGLMVPFAVVAGFSGAVSDTSTVVIAGVITIAAGAVTMGLGGYQAGKEETDHFEGELLREKGGMNTISGAKDEETAAFFANLGLSKEIQDKAAHDIASDKKQWFEFLAEHGLSPAAPDPKRPIKSALNIGLSYAVGGLVPLGPFFFSNTPVDALRISAVITLIGLFIFAFFRSRIMGVNPWIGAIRVTLFGALAAGGAFGVARLFDAL